jgi:hypothetical protein
MSGSTFYGVQRLEGPSHFSVSIRVKSSIANADNNWKADNNTIEIGLFETEIDAAKAYDKFASFVSSLNLNYRKFFFFFFIKFFFFFDYLIILI